MLVALVALGAAIQSCQHEILAPYDGTITPVSESNNCNWDTVYFVKEILPIIISNCTGSACHNADAPAEGISLTNYDEIVQNGRIKPGKPNDSKLYEVITASGGEEKMPPSGWGSLTPEQIRAIKIWIEQGALNNDCNSGCDTTVFTYSAAIWPILESSCKGCHQGSNPGGHTSITNYTEVKQLVNNDMLEESIFHIPGTSFMPPGGQLDSCSLKKIRKWLDAGAPNN